MAVNLLTRAHTERLRASCRYLDFDLPISDEEMDRLKDEVLKANNIIDGYVRAFCWRGSEMMAISAQRLKFIWRLLPGSGQAILTQKPK